VSDLSTILKRLHQGDSDAAAELMPIVYNELRRLAAHKMAQQPPGQTLQATALVHEAWLKLVGSGKQEWENRKHFFSAAAEAMRQILIDRARKRQRLRHGGGLERVDVNEVEVTAPADPDIVLALNEALDELTKSHPSQVEVVRLKFFIGLSEQETAEILGISERTVERHWAYAQAWLFDRIGPKHQA
jgi:RNA polymerase sigma factor (TIGR02999 family)